ncbi:uncharacterized protein LOC144165165 isoform X2 [Haemaphysalis longicornis]
MAILTRCCFMCNVRDGTLVIGITCIVCRVLASVACVVLLVSYTQEGGAEQGSTVKYKLTSLKLLLPDNLLVVLFSGFLVIGLVKNRRYYLIPWIVWVSASCIILIILWCLRAIIAIKDQAKQAFESTMVSCLKEVKGDTQDVNQLKQAVCGTPVLRKKFLECFKNDLAGALVENTIFNHQIRSKGREILKRALRLIHNLGYTAHTAHLFEMHKITKTFDMYPLRLIHAYTKETKKGYDN